MTERVEGLPSIYQWQLAQMGYGLGTNLGWSYDINMAALSNALLTTSGRQWFTRIEWPFTQTVSSISVVYNTAGGTLTSGQCFATLYSSGGTRIAYTADQSAAWVGAAGNLLTMNLATPSATVAIPGRPGDFIWASFHFNGTTGPTFRGAANYTNNVANFGLAASAYRACFQNLSSTTTPTDPITPGSMSLSSIQIWAGLK